MSESTIKCENCEEEFTDKEAYESHRELSHENDSFQFIDSRDAVDEQEFVRINGKREYNPNPNAGLYDNKLFREGSAKERTSILGEHHDGTDHEHPHEEEATEDFWDINSSYGIKTKEELIQERLFVQKMLDNAISMGDVEAQRDYQFKLDDIKREEASLGQRQLGQFEEDTDLFPYFDVDGTSDPSWNEWGKSQRRHLGNNYLNGESLDEEQSEDYLEARDELIADAIGSEKLGSNNPFKIGNEKHMWDGKTFTCSMCGKTGDDFMEMSDEICPEGNGGGHALPIFGDESKANEDDYDQRDQSELETDTSYEDEIYGGNSGNPDNWYQTEDGNWEVYGDGESYAKEDDYQHNFDELTSLAQDKIEDGGISQDTWDGSSKEERKDIESELHGESEDVDYEKEDELSAGFIEQQHTEPKEDKNKDLDDVDISLEKIDYVYPTKVGEAKKKSYVTEAIDGLDEEYNHEEPSDEEEIVDLVTARKMSGFSDESIARELHITYGVDPDYARNRVYGIEVSTNDKVANTFFGKMYRECTESEKDELKMYSGSDY